MRLGMSPPSLPSSRWQDTAFRSLGLLGVRRLGGGAAGGALELERQSRFLPGSVSSFAQRRKDLTLESRPGSESCLCHYYL